MADKKIQDMNENKERFLAVSKEVYPLMNQIKQLLKKHGFIDTTHITIGADDYMELRPYETEWALRQYSTDGKPRAIFEYRDEIPLEEV